MFSKLISTALLISTVFVTEANARCGSSGGGSRAHGRAWSSTNEGKFSISILGGIMPVVYLNRKLPNNSSNPTVIFKGIKPPTFNNQFNTPSDLAGEFGYIVKNSVEIFYNFDWSYASGKNYSFSSNGVGFKQKFSKYNGYGNYLGTRYYFTFRSIPLKPFVGAKIGIFSQNGVSVNQVATGSGTTDKSNVTYFKKKNSFAGGFQLGVDWQLLKYLSLTLKSEVLGTFNRNGQIILNNPTLGTFKVGKTGGQLLIPVTFGVKFTL